MLIDNSINRNGRFSYLPVSDNELALSPPYRNHGVNRFNTGVKRSIHGLARNNAGGDFFNRIKFSIFFRSKYRPPPVGRLSKSVYDPPDHFFSDAHRKNASRPADDIALFNLKKVPEDNDADGIFFEI